MKPDCIVMRHVSSGEPNFVSPPTSILPVINAGDGFTHENTLTQELLDGADSISRPARQLWKELNNH